MQLLTRKKLIRSVQSRFKNAYDHNNGEARSTITEVDFGTSPASLKTPKSPLVIAIKDSASNSLTDAGYDELNAEVSAFVIKLLAAAKLDSIRETGDPYNAPVEPKHIKSALVTTLKELGVGIRSSKTFKMRTRDLALAMFAAALGMTIELGLEMKSVSRPLEVTTAVAILILSTFLIYFTGE